MKTLKTMLIACMALALGLVQAAQACTTFQIQKQGQVYYGRNYDWMVAEALVLINKRGTKKASYLRRTDKGRPMEWTSKYGSLTFNQYGREMPTGGMNQAGLVVESMALHATEYPPHDERPYLASNLIWKQYVLDNFATVDEAVAGIKKVRISQPPKSLGTHYLISDAKGGCAIIEFLDGKLVVHQGKSLPIRALTNNTYAEARQAFNKGGPVSRDWWDSIPRFKITAKMMQAYGADPKQPPLDYAFEVLKAASQKLTQWSIVYDQNNLKIYYFTKNNPKLRSIDLKKLDMACGQPVLMLDVDAGGKGDITSEFKPYTLAANHDLIVRTFGNTPMFKNIPQQVLKRLAAFPEKCKCVKP